jgi:uncharacterized membrane protein YbaN (DUF454 family)
MRACARRPVSAGPGGWWHGPAWASACSAFILLAAFAAARGSERLHRRLLADPRFGPMIRDWRAGGTVRRRAKWTATWTMLASALVLVGLVLLRGGDRWWIAALPIACMAAVATWLWRRPEPAPRRDPGQD